MALIFSIADTTLSDSSVGQGFAHGLGVTPDVVIITPKGVTGTGQATLISMDTVTVTLSYQGAVSVGSFDIDVIKYHSIIQ